MFSQTPTPENLPETLPGLKDLKGGKKQAFNNANREFILMVYEKYGDEVTKRMFNLKDSTLASIVKKAERQVRKNITLADRAFNSAYRANERLYELEPAVEAIQDVLVQQLDSDQDLRNTLSDFFQLQAKLNEMAAKIVQGRDQKNLYFTEHIRHNDILEVSSTPENVSHKVTKRIKAGPTSKTEADRFSVSGNMESGKSNTSRVGGRKRGNLRERYENSKRRWRHG